jgi:hypothetical protein
MPAVIANTVSRTQDETDVRFMTFLPKLRG